MSLTTVTSNLQIEQWEKGFFVEYVRKNRFNRYMGKSENSIIQTIMTLSKRPGADITVALVTRLTGAGVTGDNTLEGNEEALGNYGHQVTINQRRHAVAIGHMEQKRSQINMLNAAKVQLRTWAMEQLRDDIIRAMKSPNVDGTTSYASSTQTEKDTWLTANTDRVLFGELKSNQSAGDHSASLDAIDSTNDVLKPAIVSLARRMARDADPHIRPVRVGEDEEWFVMFCNPWAFRDFKNNSTYQQAAREAELRGKNNPLFRDGDLVWDGVILREIPENTSEGDLVLGGSSGTVDVAANFLCGAQSILVAWGEKTKAIFDERDFQNIQAVGVKEMLGVEKATLVDNDTQHGMVTVYTAGVGDS